MDEKDKKEEAISRLTDEERALLTGFYKGYTNLDFSIYSGDAENILKDLMDFMKVSLFWCRRLRASATTEDKATIQDLINYLNAYLIEYKGKYEEGIPALFSKANTLSELLVKYNLDPLVQKEYSITK